VRDANTPGGLFTKVDTPLPGDVIAYGDRRVSGGKISQGHVGLITEVEDGKIIEVAHCSSGNWSQFRNALLTTGPHIFERRKAIVIRFDEVTR
jgi:hypothetical protein